MSARERLFKLDLPDGDPPETGEVVVAFPHASAEVAPAGPAELAAQPQPGGIVDRLRPQVERFTAGWRAAWVGDGVLGMRPRPVADLARQFWTSPPAYIRDAWILRIPYAIYGVPVIAVTAAAHLLLLIISYPSLLAGTGLLVLFVSLFL